MTPIFPNTFPTETFDSELSRVTTAAIATLIGFIDVIEVTGPMSGQDEDGFARLIRHNVDLIQAAANAPDVFGDLLINLAEFVTLAKEFETTLSETETEGRGT